MRLVRLLAVLPMLAGASTVGAVTAVGPSAVGCASAASAHHAALVIEHSNGSTLKYCIGFDTDQVTGQYLLDASGVEKYEQDYGSMGEAVCQIDYEPDPYPPGCWTASSSYWAMYVSRGGGGWSQSSLGVSSQTFHDGDAEGFRFESQSAYLTPPSPAGICPAPTPPPTPASTPRSTPRPTSAPAHHSAPATVGPGGTPTSAPVAPTTSPPAGATAEATAPPDSSATPDVVVVAGPSGSRPASSITPGSGLIAASALGAAMVALLIVQGVRERSRRRRRSATSRQ